MTVAPIIQPDSEILPGYRLLRKIGSGGYGEVWLCDAPGGLRKAIKIVYGTLDEERAASEMRSLQRIREVKHPFILSLERIEVVDGHLMIVTELAESSLYDQFQAYCLQGLKGIPRERLLGYLRDSADALDFLSLRHDLQHLDVKPGNILLVADRVKLADFGVVKSLSEGQQSCIGGLTPSYAAPEVFDGRAGRHSDQYSLAIMYYELLTGHLPFDGTTMAQLATQHLQRPPNLEMVSDAERLVLNRALSKDPSQRFPSCMEFIDQLANAEQFYRTSLSVKEEKAADVAAPFAPKRKLIARNLVEVDHKQSTVVLSRRPIVDLPALPDSAVGAWRQSPCLFIGLGGVGCRVLAELRSIFLESEAPTEHTHWLLIDTDNDGMNIGDDNPALAFRDEEKLHIPLQDAHYYREAPAELFETVSRRWLYNIPRNKQTGGARPLGQVALLDHQQSIGHALQETLDYLLSYQHAGHDDHDSSKNHCYKPRIYLVTSAHGGTGSAIFCDIGFAIRNILHEKKVSDYQMIGVVSSAVTSTDPKEMIASAASLAFFREIAHYFNTQNDYYGLTERPFYGTCESTTSHKAPLDHIYCFAGDRLSSKDGLTNTVHQMAQMMIMDSSTNVGHSLDYSRANTSQSTNISQTPWLRSVSFHPCCVEAKNRLSEIIQNCIAEYCKKWFPLSVRAESVGKSPLRLEKDPERTTGILSETEEYVQELSHNLEQLLSDLRLSSEAWLHNCANAVRALYPRSRNPFAEPIEPIVENLFRNISEGCRVRSRLTSMPCKINLGLLTGLQLQAKKIEETLLKAKQRHEHDLDAMKLLDSNQGRHQNDHANAQQQLSPEQVAEVIRKLKFTILRYDVSYRIVRALVAKLEDTLQQERRRMMKLHRSWSTWPSLLPEQGVGLLLKNLESDALGMKLVPFIDEIRGFIQQALRCVSTLVVLGEGEISKISGATEGATLLKILKQDPEMAFDFPKLLFALENLLRQEHPYLADGQLEHMWFQHQVGQTARQCLTDKTNQLNEFGGMRRLMLAAPVAQSNILARGNWREQMKIPLSINSAPVEEKIIVVELEQLDLAIICDRMWGNSPELMTLSERMQVRTDTAWQAIQPATPPEQSAN
jgi:serine/threonine protein kinase